MMTAMIKRAAAVFEHRNDDTVKHTIRAVADSIQVALLLSLQLETEHAKLREAITSAARALHRLTPEPNDPRRL